MSHNDKIIRHYEMSRGSTSIPLTEILCTILNP